MGKHQLYCVGMRLRKAMLVSFWTAFGSGFLLRALHIAASHGWSMTQAASLGPFNHTCDSSFGKCLELNKQMRGS